MQTTTTSTQYSLNTRDLLKGLLVAVITPVLTVIMTSINAGSLVFNWKLIAMTAVAAGIAYIVKNFLSPATIVVSNVPEKSMEAVKDGAATVEVVKT